MELILEYEQMGIDWTEVYGRKIKTIEEKKEYKILQNTRFVNSKNVDVAVEAKAALRDEKWERFEISEVGNIFV